jgi:hypothetical protein
MASCTGHSAACQLRQEDNAATCYVEGRQGRCVFKVLLCRSTVAGAMKGPLGIVLLACLLRFAFDFGGSQGETSLKPG